MTGPATGTQAQLTGSEVLRPGPLPLLALGGLVGLAWAAGLRGFMAQIAGSESEVTWVGTFAWILLPGVVTGMLLAWAEHLRRTGRGRRRRWLALAPLTFAAVLVPGLIDPATFLAAGVGGGALGVPLMAMAGGYALSGRGRVRARGACALVALSAVPIWALTVPGFGGPGLAVTTPRGSLGRGVLLVLPGGAGPRLRRAAPGSAGRRGCRGPPLG